MSITSSTDPLTYVHEWLWSALEGDQTFCDLVHQRRRLKTATFYNPTMIAGLAEADTPSVAIYLSTLGFHPDAATNLSLVEADFTVNVITAGVNTDDVFPVIWAIVRRFIEVRPDLIDDDYIYDCVLLQSETKYVTEGRIGIITACGLNVQIAMANTTIRS